MFYLSINKCFTFDVSGDDKELTPGCRSFQRADKSLDVTGKECSLYI